jgi:iron complex outermembrane receptor protein
VVGVIFGGPENHLGSVTYWDLQGTWDTPWDGRITLGVNNIFEREPPVSYSAFANSFDPKYDVPGRFWYVSYSQKF